MVATNTFCAAYLNRYANFASFNTNLVLNNLGLLKRGLRLPNGKFI